MIIAIQPVYLTGAATADNWGSISVDVYHYEYDYAYSDPSITPDPITCSKMIKFLFWKMVNFHNFPLKAVQRIHQVTPSNAAKGLAAYPSGFT